MQLLGATIAACAEGARSDGSGSWAFALKLFDEAQLEGLTMSTPCLNNALQACVIASYWESSLALASELNGEFEPTIGRPYDESPMETCIAFVEAQLCSTWPPN